MIYTIDHVDLRSAARALDESCPSTLRAIAAELERNERATDALLDRMERTILDWPGELHERTL